MSYEWSARDFQAAQPFPIPSGLSLSLMKAVFGAAITTLPMSALAEDREDRALSATTISAAVAAAAAPAATAVPVATSPFAATVVSATVAASAATASTTVGAQDRAAVTLPVAASAEQRTYGPLRPGLGTPANTMAPGQVSIETGFVDWQRDDTDGVRSDTLLVGATTVRVGITRSVEAMVGWTPFGHVRVRDETGETEQANRVGDALLGFKVNLLSPDGSGLSAAIQPFAVLPIGRPPVGAGDWGAGVVAPVSYDLSKTVNVALTGEVDAATNTEGKGRHLSYSAVAGVSVAVTSAVKLTGELSCRRDDDPVAHLTQSLGSLSVSWGARDDLQFDLGTAMGLNRDSPDLRLYAGMSRRF